MDIANEEITPVPGDGPADPAAAKKQAQGLTLVAYWGYNKQGHRIACCAWMKLRHRESINDTARRLSARACASAQV